MIGVVVEENNLNGHMGTLRKVLGADAVSTVTGRGYRFALPASSLSDVYGRAPSPVTPYAAKVLACPDKPSIVVLPFAHLGGNAAHEDFTDGFTDEVITGLSRFRSLFVISRNSVFTYQGRCVDVRSVARELCVR